MTLSELEDWAETHYDVSIMVDYISTYDDSYFHDLLGTSGIGGLQKAAFDITNKFQRLHNDTCWGIDAEYMTGNIIVHLLKQKKLIGILEHTQQKLRTPVS